MIGRLWSLRHLLITMTAFAVISDAILIPFYPQFFLERYGVDSSVHVGAYVAAISIVVMCVFPLWVRVARRVETLHILQYTQGAAALLCLASYFAPDVVSYWVLSMGMFAFKSSYLLTFPYLMRLENDDTRAGTIGLLSVVAHLGVVVGAVAGGAVIEHGGVRQCVLWMAAADVVQMALCAFMIRSRRMVPVLHAQAPERQAPARFTLARGAPILGLAAIMLLFDFGAALVRPFFAVYWQQVSAIGSEALSGLVFAVPKIVAVAALLINRFIQPGEGHVARRTLPNLLLGGLGLLMQAAPDAWTVLLGRVLFGWSLFQLVVNFDLTLFRLSTPDDFGRDYGIINFFQNAGVLLASFTAGSLVGAMGLASTFVVAAGSFLVATALWRWWFGSGVQPGATMPAGDVPPNGTGHGSAPGTATADVTSPSGGTFPGATTACEERLA